MRYTGGGETVDRLRVLVVEDVDDIRDLLVFLLRAEGAEVRDARSARDALGIAATWDFDVLLTDLGLPDMAGDDLIREILGMKSRVRVVVVTGFGEPYAGRAREAGARIVITKPLDWSLLRTQLVAGHEAVAV